MKAGEGEQVAKKDYSKEIIFSLKDFQEKGHLLQIVTIPPNTKQRLHVHEVQTEVYFALEGECIINLEGKDFFTKKGDAFVASPGDRHFLWNKSDKEFRLLVFKINMPENSDDTNWLQ